MVRAKFVVTSKEETLFQTTPETVPMVTVKMNPVGAKHRQNPQNGKWEIVENENSMFWQATPSGSLQLGCVNKAAADRFILGQEYYLDFTPAPKPAE